jgi:hypothetical protein
VGGLRFLATGPGGFALNLVLSVGLVCNGLLKYKCPSDPCCPVPGCCSVHKSQGMTIERVRVCLDGVFAPGQAYVAIRCGCQWT